MSHMSVSFRIVRYLVLLTFGFCFGCVSRPAFKQEVAGLNQPPASAVQKLLESKPPGISLEAYPRQGFAPLTVTLHATLDGVSQTDPRFACMYQEWNFGDGGVSGEKRDCQNSNAGQMTDTEFITEHVFAKSGSYLISFRLGNNQLVTKRVAVTVYDRF